MAFKRSTAFIEKGHQKIVQLACQFSDRFSLIDDDAVTLFPLDWPSSIIHPHKVVFYLRKKWNNARRTTTFWN